MARTQPYRYVPVTGVRAPTPRRKRNIPWKVLIVSTILITSFVFGGILTMAVVVILLGFFGVWGKSPAAQRDKYYRDRNRAQKNQVREAQQFDPNRPYGD